MEKDESGKGKVMLNILSYPPVQRGFAALILGGIVLPQAGMAVLRLNLLPLRFMLLHGILLGGALGLAFQFSPLLGSLTINLLLVTLIVLGGRTFRSDLGGRTALFMVLSAALASLVIYRFNVPAKDTLSILWGSPFLVSSGELFFTLFLTLAVIAARVVFHKALKVLYFDRELAQSMGISVQNWTWIIVIIIALLVSSAMRILGALLLDLLLLLPALTACWIAPSFKSASWVASIIGFLLSVSGFFLSLLLDIPLSAGLAIPALVIAAVIYLFRAFMINRNQKGIYPSD